MLRYFIEFAFLFLRIVVLGHLYVLFSVTKINMLRTERSIVNLGKLKVMYLVILCDELMSALSKE